MKFFVSILAAFLLGMATHAMIFSGASDESVRIAESDIAQSNAGEKDAAATTAMTPRATTGSAKNSNEAQKNSDSQRSRQNNFARSSDVERTAKCLLPENREAALQACSQLLKSGEVFGYDEKAREARMEYLVGNELLWVSDVKKGIFRQNPEVIEASIGAYEVDVNFHIQENSRTYKVRHELDIAAKGESEVTIKDEKKAEINGNFGYSLTSSYSGKMVGTDSRTIHMITRLGHATDTPFISRYGYKLPVDMQPNEQRRLPLLLLTSKNRWEARSGAYALVKRLE